MKQMLGLTLFRSVYHQVFGLCLVLLMLRKVVMFRHYEEDNEGTEEKKETELENNKNRRRNLCDCEFDSEVC